MAKCEFCDKGVVFGIQVSHSHRRSNRPWKPNVKLLLILLFLFLEGDDMELIITLGLLLLLGLD